MNTIDAPLGGSRAPLRSWASVGAITLLSVCVGVAAQAAVAATYGTSPPLDALYVALMLATYLPTVYQTAVADPLVPAYMKALKPDAFFRALLTYTLVGGVVVAVVLVAAHRPLVRWTAPGLSKEQLADALNFLLILLPVPPLFAVVSCLTAILAAERRFTAARSSALFTPVAMLVAVVMFAKAGVEAMAWATSIGYAVNAIFLWSVAGRPRLSFDLRPLKSEAGRTLVRTGGPLAVTIAAGALHVVIDRGMASLLVPGSIAILAYAEKLNGVLTTVFLLPLTFVALPYLSAARGPSEFGRVFATNLRAVLIVFIPVAVFIGSFALPLVDIALRRGMFDVSASRAVAAALAGYMVGMPFYAVAALVGRGLVAVGKTWLLAVLAPFALLLKWQLNSFLMPSHGVGGATLATSVGYAVFAVITSLILFPVGERSHLARALILAVGCAAAAAAALGATSLLIPGDLPDGFGALPLLTLAGLFFSLFYGLLLYAAFNWWTRRSTSASS